MKKKPLECYWVRRQLRYGLVGDAEVCQGIVRENAEAFGFVNLASLREAARRGELLVCEVDGEVVGFVSWYGRKDGWNTIYEVAVRRGYKGVGIGRSLVYAVPTPVRLKCPADMVGSNMFYAGLGFEMVGVEDGHKRPLNVWEMRLLAIHCQGSNRKVPAWAGYSGMAYGTRSSEGARDWPFMLDCDWKKLSTTEEYERRFIPLVQKYRPVFAMVRDYERAEQREEMLREIEMLRGLGVLRIGVVPKFEGAIQDIPRDCIVAVSVPSSYAGYVPPLEQLRGRRVHLLGGNPKAQLDLIVKMRGIGAQVLSVDYNVHERNAQNGMVFDGGVWNIECSILNYTIAYDELVWFSGQNIRKFLVEGMKVTQPMLL